MTQSPEPRAQSHTMPEGADGFAELTGREREVLPLLAEQLTNEEIAEALDISPWTVKRHVAAILEKLHVPNRKKAGQLYRDKMARDGLLRAHGGRIDTLPGLRRHHANVELYHTIPQSHTA